LSRKKGRAKETSAGQAVQWSMLRQSDE